MFLMMTLEFQIQGLSVTTAAIGRLYFMVCGRICLVTVPK